MSDLFNRETTSVTFFVNAAPQDVRLAPGRYRLWLLSGDVTRTLAVVLNRNVTIDTGALPKSFGPLAGTILYQGGSTGVEIEVDANCDLITIALYRIAGPVTDAAIFVRLPTGSEVRNVYG